MPNVNQIIVGSIILVVVVVGIFLFTTGKITQVADKSDQGEVVAEVFSIAGRVTSVNIQDNSFVLLQPREEVELTIKLGTETEFIRLVFPFDITNPPEDVTFTPERKPVTIEDLKIGDQVFVRSSHAVNVGEDVVDPLEIQILP